MPSRAPLVLLLLLVPGILQAQVTNDELMKQVIVAESSFAATLEHRDLPAFASFVAPEAIFFGSEGPARGREAVVESWRGLFTGPTPPFSWKPGAVVVLASGTLALSSGPVLDPTGQQVATFNSVWRREQDGTWKVVFDKGCHACNCAKPS